jgi:hypothetical protein
VFPTARRVVAGLGCAMSKMREKEERRRGHRGLSRRTGIFGRVVSGGGRGGDAEPLMDCTAPQPALGKIGIDAVPASGNHRGS